ncbi:hypothetical protein [Desmospora profundinema]|uniref:Uncharacterized protein n=1 Tax=Desmospora profundinema TaxID=1571184 RepID=A0ABU1IK95_9BACL|nr:hypothetical protein [Desmospora profundinema]MDR6225195.1 hypothetical protein [Desmospora profundinema]
MRRSVLSTLLIGSAVAVMFGGRKQHGADRLMRMLNGHNQPRWLKNVLRNLGLMRVVSVAYGRGLIRRFAR